MPVTVSDILSIFYANHRLFQVTHKRYVAGLVVKDGKVTGAAPIIKWTVGMRAAEAIVRLREQGGEVKEVQ